ncbi:MAG: alanine racemase [Actinomycetota bacterium]
MLRDVSVDLGAISHNFARIQQIVSPAEVMPIVKADAYGHGAVRVAESLVDSGARRLGVADSIEALELRAAGVSVPILCWLFDPAQAFGPLISAEVAIGVSTLQQLELVAEAASLVGRAKIHIKLDTGLGRNGFAAADWQLAFERTAAALDSGLVEVEGTFSHLANASQSENLEQRDRFEAGLGQLQAAGINPGIRHLAASEAAIATPELRYDLVRVGIASYGQSPTKELDLAQLGMRPAMRVAASVVNVKHVPAGHGVSYGFDYRTPRPTQLALVAFGYADGLPRQAAGFEVLLNGRRVPIVGRIAMDQFVLDIGDLECQIGDEVVIVGNADHGEPTASELAEKAGTINYDIVTRMGRRPGRRYLEGE